MRVVLVLALCLASGSCVRPPPFIPTNYTAPHRYLIPLYAKDTDYVCAETAKEVIHNDCVTVRVFRLFAMPYIRADP